MAYYCRDCSYKGAGKSNAGACPACGSTNYLSLRPQTSKEIIETHKGRLLILVALWAVLIYLIQQKLYGV